MDDQIKTHSVKSNPKKEPKRPLHKTPFSDYFNSQSDIDKGQRYSHEFGSVLILSLVE